MRVRWRQRTRDLRRDTRGLSTVEYIILFVLIAIIAIAMWQLLGGALEDNVVEARDEIAQVGVAGAGMRGGTAMVEGARAVDDESTSGMSGSMAGGAAGEGGGESSMGGGGSSMMTGAAGVVSRPSEGGPSVYTVGQEEQTSAGTMWIVIGLMTLLVLGGFVMYSKMKRGNPG